MTAIFIHHPVTDDIVELKKIDMLDDDRVKIHYRAKGQRGWFVVHKPPGGEPVLRHAKQQEEP